MSAPDEQQAPQVRVTSGGVPDAEQLVALVLALTPRGGGGETDAEGSGGPGPGAGVPAWTRAALLEGVGGRRAVSAPDLAGLG